MKFLWLAGILLPLISIVPRGSHASDMAVEAELIDDYPHFNVASTEPWLANAASSGTSQQQQQLRVPSVRRNNKPQAHLELQSGGLELLRAPRTRSDSDNLRKIPDLYDKVPVHQDAIQKPPALPNYINVQVRGQAVQSESRKVARPHNDHKGKGKGKGEATDMKRSRMTPTMVQLKGDYGKSQQHHHQRPDHPHRCYDGCGCSRPYDQHGRPVIPVLLDNDNYRQFPGVTFVTTLFTQTLTFITPTSVTNAVTSTGFTTIPTTFNLTVSSSSSSTTSDSTIASSHLQLVLLVLSAILLFF